MKGGDELAIAPQLTEEVARAVDAIVVADDETVAEDDRVMKAEQLCVGQKETAVRNVLGIGS